MLGTRGYVQLNSWRNSWTCRLRLPETRFEVVRNALSQLAIKQRWPVAAFIFGDANEPVTELMLYRDPSKTYGMPSVSESDLAAHTLAAEMNWTIEPEPLTANGMLIGLGLREGYAPDAPQHELGELIQRLPVRNSPKWTCRSARLVSARVVEGALRWYDEQGAVLHGPTYLLPTIATAALEFAQQRFVVTSFDEGRVYTFTQ